MPPFNAKREARARRSIWPDVSETQSGRVSEPPLWEALESTRQAMSLVQGVNLTTAERVRSLLAENEALKWQLTIGIQPAGVTTAQSLGTLWQAQQEFQGRAEIRLLLPCQVRDHWPHQNLTLVEMADAIWMAWIGSSPSLGINVAVEPFLNLWFRIEGTAYTEASDYVMAMTAIGIPLTERAIQIPFLVPAQGSEEAERVWRNYERSLLVGNGEEEEESAGLHAARTIDALVIDPEKGVLITNEQGQVVAPPATVAAPKPRDVLADRIASLFSTCDQV